MYKIIIVRRRKKKSGAVGVPLGEEFRTRVYMYTGFNGLPATALYTCAPVQVLLYIILMTRARRRRRRLIKYGFATRVRDSHDDKSSVSPTRRLVAPVQSQRVPRLVAATFMIYYGRPPPIVSAARQSARLSGQNGTRPSFPVRYPARTRTVLFTAESAIFFAFLRSRNFYFMFFFFSPFRRQSHS